MSQDRDLEFVTSLVTMCMPVDEFIDKVSELVEKDARAHIAKRICMKCKGSLPEINVVKNPITGQAEESALCFTCRDGIGGQILASMVKKTSQLSGLFQRIQKITDTVDNNLLHFHEEIGEFSTELLISRGSSRKKSEEGVLPELCDVLVCILALLANFTTDLDVVMKIVDSKVAKWEADVAERS